MNGDEVRAQLEKILSSPQFSQSGRLSRFLRFVVEAAQTGQADSVKEYLIGVEVFDRGKDFDPRIDPIVRVQAAKLRSKLMEYYAHSGAQDPIVISMPKGSYATEIRENAPDPASPKARPVFDRCRIAVLPFVNMSSDPENEYFSDGLTEELINRLASVPSLQVVARTSAFSFKGRNEDLREVGAKLHVGTVMEGSVRKAGDQLRVTAQLIDVQSGYHLFSQTYQREYKNVFELQDEIAQSVVNQIAPLSAKSSVLVKTRAVNLDAYNKYLHGMYALSNRFVDRQWIDSFHEAIQIDPGCAPAWAGLSYGYFMQGWFYQMPAGQALPLSKEAALKTLGLDSNLGIGHGSLCLVQGAYEWNWAECDASFRRATQLQPGLAVIYMPYATCCLLPQSRLEEACAIAEEGLSLDPYNPLSLAQMIFVYVNAGRYEDALRQYAFSLEVNPKYAPFFYAAGLAHEWQGNLDPAIACYRRTLELGAGLPAPLSALGYVLAATGEKDEAVAIAERLQQIPDPPAVDLAVVYLGLGDEAEALRWLEVAVQQRSIRLVLLPTDRRFGRLAGHPRFQAILQRMGLQAAATTA